VVEIRELPEGRFEVYAEGRHCEAFEGCLGAIAAAHALASELAMESHAAVTLTTPWGERSVTKDMAEKGRHPYPAMHG